MTIIDLKRPKDLLSKRNFDRIEPNKKASAETEALNINSDIRISETGLFSASRLSDALISYKERSASMSNFSCERTHFSMLPKILSQIGLTAIQRSVYWAIIEAAGENGKCTKSYSTLAKMSGVCEKTLKNTIPQLCEENKTLKKPLIFKKTRFTECGDQDTCELIPNDIWNENQNRFKKEIIGGVPHTPPQVPHTPRGGVPHTPGGVSHAYNEDIVNTPSLKETNVNEKEIVSFSSLSKEQEEELLKFSIQNKISEGITENKKPGIKKKDITDWGKKGYEFSEIEHAMKMTLTSEIKKTYPGFVTKMLKDGISKKCMDSEFGRKVVEGTVKQSKMHWIEIKKDHFIDEISGEDHYYDQPEEILHEILRKSFERYESRKNRTNQQVIDEIC